MGGLVEGWAAVGTDTEIRMDVSSFSHTDRRLFRTSYEER